MSSRRDGSTRTRAFEGTRTIAQGLSPGKSTRTRVRICSRPPRRSRLLEMMLVADCAKGQRQAKPLDDWNLRREQGVFLRARDATPFSSIYPLKIGKKEMKASLASYRSAFMVRETLRWVGRPHTPSSWPRSGSRGTERPAATSCTKRGTSR